MANTYADEFIVDIKILNPDVCRDVLSGNVSQYLSNLKLLDLNKTTFRIPVNEFSLNDQNLIIELLNEFKPKKLEIFKLHNLAKRKYEILDKDFYHEVISDEQLNDFKDRLVQIVPETEIIEI